MVGREREIAEGHGLLAEVEERSVGLLFHGAPGIGKTTIWSAVVEEADRRGHRVLKAQPAEAEADLVFAVLIDLLRDVGDADLTVLPEPQRSDLAQALRRTRAVRRADPTAVALGTLGTLRALAADAPTIVAIDDLQWADSSSRRVLSFALRRLGSDRVGLLGTVRTGVDNELTRLTDDRTVRVERLEVEALGSRDLVRLVFERTGRALTPAAARRLVQLSAGNPYHALQLSAVDDSALEVPDDLTAALRARLTTLSPTARAAGLLAACLGRVDERFAEATGGGGVDELRQAEILVERRGALTFAHPLLASALLGMHTSAERRAAHRKLAGALEDPDERAVHLARGVDAADEHVALELEQAAARLERRGAPDAAARVAERAAALTPVDEGGARVRRLVAAAEYHRASGEGRTRSLPLLTGLAEALPEGAERARVLVRLGWIGAELDLATTGEAIDAQERALREAGGAPDVAASAHAALARLLALGGELSRALAHAERAVETGAGAEAGGIFPSPLGELATLRFYAGRGLDEGLFAQAEAVEEALGGLGEPYQTPRRQLGWALLYAGDLGRARRLLGERLERARALERAPSVAGCLLHLVDLEVRAGNLAAAERHAAEFRDLDRQLRGAGSSEWYPSAIVALHLGRVEEARRALTAGIAYSREIGSAIWLAHHLGALGLLELSLARLDAAREALLPLPVMLRSAGVGEWSVHPVHPDAIEALVGLGELSVAAELLDELEGYATRLDRPWGLAAAARCRSLVASAAGEHAESLRAAERALVEHERLDWPFERARTLLVAGGALRRLGRRRDAATALAEARAAFSTLRNPLWIARVDAEERRIGGRRGTGDVLTPTEQRVAELAGEGLRNAEIAARLYVTPKTVEGVLSRVYRKLGVRSRAELAARMAAGKGS